MSDAGKGTDLALASEVQVNVSVSAHKSFDLPWAEMHGNWVMNRVPLLLVWSYMCVCLCVYVCVCPCLYVRRARAHLFVSSTSIWPTAPFHTLRRLHPQVVVGCEVLAGSRVDEDYGEELLSSPYCTGKGGESLPRRLMRWACGMV